jgi:hypothetical protein
MWLGQITFNTDGQLPPIPPIVMPPLALPKLNVKAMLSAMKILAQAKARVK